MNGKSTTNGKSTQKTGWQSEKSAGPAVMAPEAKEKKASATEMIDVTFACGVKPDAKSVFLAGDFNNWSQTTTPMTKADRDFRATVKLSLGEHQYKFYVDGDWYTDPRAARQVPNGLGTANSVIRV